MKRWVFLFLFGLTAVAAVVGMQTAGRERSYQTLLSRGDSDLRNGDTFGAIEAFSGAIALRQDSSMAHLRRGESYRLRGELEAASRDFRTAAALDPSSPAPLEALADVYYERRRYDRAIDTYEHRLQLAGSTAHLRYKLALAYYRAGRRPDATAALSEALKLDARMPDAHYLLGLCLRDQRHATEAVDAFERAVTLAPGMIPAREELATLYEELGRYPNQLEQLQVLAALDSAHVERQIAVGAAHARAGHPDLAASTFANAIERSPEEPLIYQELGRMWLDVAETRNDLTAVQRAIDAFNRVGMGPTVSSEALTLYGRALALNGELDAARRLLEQATHRFPVNSASFVALADVAEQQHDLPVARAALLDYQAVVGDDADAVTRAGRIGVLSLALGDTGVALRWLRRAFSGQPEHAPWLIAMATAQFDAGDTKAARVSLAKALELAPDNGEALALQRRMVRASLR